MRMPIKPRSQRLPPAAQPPVRGIAVRARCRSVIGRSAFTLLEVILALGLAVLLLVAVYSALDLYWRYSSTGRQDMERAQLARALLERMAADVRSVVYREPEEEAAGDEDVEAADEETEVTEIEVVDPAEAYTGGSVGVYGDAQTLVLHISRPSRNLDYSSLIDGESINSRSSDLQSVSYFLAVSGATGLQGIVAKQATGTSILSASSMGVQGLARVEGDRLAMELAEETGDLETMASGAQLLAPEVNFLQFRYFDGIQWLDAWDSVAAGRLPQAVEIVVGFEQLDEESVSTMAAYGMATTGETFRIVVALPLAEPYLAEQEF